MTQIPDLFDHALKKHRAARVRPDALFLHDLAISECHERLLQVKKTFKAPLIIGWQTDYWAQRLGFAAAQCDYVENLALPVGRYDLIIHAMALHWANDPVGQLIQMRHALRPDGMVLLACFGAGSLTDLRDTLARTEMDMLGGVSPRVAPMGEIRDLGGLMQRAGFALPVADKVTQEVSYKNSYALMHDLRAMGETNVMYHRHKAILPRRFWRAVEACYPQGGDGRITAGFELIMLTGWAPASDQPQPLRPGSAKMRLADALNTVENPIK